MEDLKSYSLSRYLFLQRVLPELEGLDVENTLLQLEEKKELLKKLGIKKINNISVGNCLDGVVTDRIKRLKSSVGSYLKRYCERFNQDVGDGKIERCVLGRQLELKFSGMLGDGLMAEEKNYVDRNSVYFRRKC